MRQYVVDAFAERVFEGNPAAVCILDDWLPDEVMLNIARENNLADTAFVVKEGSIYKLRWVTPGGEIDLCGHATLAAGYIITRFIDPELSEVTFSTKSSGLLKVAKKGELYEMDFPAYELKKVEVTDAMTEAIGVKPVEAYMGRDLLCILGSEDDVRNLNLDLGKMKLLDGLLFHVTAKGSEFDCVSRSFVPKLSGTEDPVCGSGHCHIIPYWAEKLEKNSLIAYQASQRGGTLYCKYLGDRVIMGGKLALFSTADINIY